MEQNKKLKHDVGHELKTNKRPLKFLYEIQYGGTRVCPRLVKAMKRKPLMDILLFRTP